MCTCASCEYTDSFAQKGFDAWPRGEPAGSRRSAADYNAHIAHLWEGVQRRAIAFKPGQPPIFPPMPELFHAPARNTAFIAWNKGRKASPAETEPASPTQPGKAEPHFPAPDRERKTATIYDMRKAKKDKEAKRPRGRPKIGSPYLVRLEPRHVGIAMALGKGRIAAGVRLALERIVKSHSTG
jgi:hypothetical protein